jgi:hypothetical protein
MLLQSLRALCKAQGEAGSIWKNLEALVRATGVSGRFAYGFRTELHFADVETYQLSFGAQSFCLKVIPLLLTANKPFLGRIICIQSIVASQFLSHHN